MTKVNPLPLPDHYDPTHASDPDYAVHGMGAVYELMESAALWRKVHKFDGVESDRRIITFLDIDDQNDFGFPTGSLPVLSRSGTGAMDARRRKVEFLYRYMHIISAHIPTLDSHIMWQIFFAIAHLTADGHHPAPNTVITAAEYRDGKYRPNPAFAAQLGVPVTWLTRQFIHYCEELEKVGEVLIIWDYHTLIGTWGHRLAGATDAARLFHSFARGAANIPEIKGGNPLTEHYSIFRPNVMTCWDGRPIPKAQKNAKLIETLRRSHVVIKAGLALDKCVRKSIDDYIDEIMAIDAELVRKIYILRDCTASVVVPGVVDLTEEGEEALAKFEAAGAHVVESTTPIEEWPEIDLAA